MGKGIKKSKWTYMVYIAGDNNLDPAALKDIAEMAKVGSSEELNIIVQLDRARDRLSACLPERERSQSGDAQAGRAIQKTDKTHHGRHASLNQSEPKLLESWNIRNSSILFVDDCITSGMTARLCYETLVGMGNHVDGLIWVSAGG